LRRTLRENGREGTNESKTSRPCERHPAEDQADSERFEALFADIHDILVSESVDTGGIDPSLKTETPPIRERILTLNAEHRITATEVKCSDTFEKKPQNEVALIPHGVNLHKQKDITPEMCQL